MFKWIKPMMLSFFTVIICFFILYSESFASTIATPEDYVEYLTEQGKTNLEALKVKEQFLEFSTEKKKKFIKYVTDPRAMSEFLEEFLSNDGRRKELYDGDIVISDEDTIIEIKSCDELKPMRISNLVFSLFVGEVMAAPILRDYRATHSREGKVLGLNIQSVYNWVLYKSNSKEATKIISGGSYVHNAIGLYMVDKITEERYIFDKKAHNCVKYKYSPFITPWVTIKVIHHDVLGFANGGSTYRLWHS